MLSLVTTAEQLYGFDRATREREQRLLLAIRERSAAAAAAAAAEQDAHRRPASPVVWARPIGLRATSPVCAVAC